MKNKIAKIILTINLLILIFPGADLSAQTNSPDFSISVIGGRTVIAGKNLYLFLNTTPNTQIPEGDLMQLSVSNLPDGLTISFPAVEAAPNCCGNFPYLWNIAAVTGFNTFVIKTASSLSPGQYSINLTGRTIKTGITKSYNLVINVLSMSDITVTSQPINYSVAIPQLSLWEKNMKNFGKFFCNQNDITQMGTYTGSVWFYDGERTFYQIADYTGDSFWQQCAKWVENVYQPQIINNQGSFQWFSMFSKGMRLNYEKTQQADSKKAVSLMAAAQQKSYGNPFGPNVNVSPENMREVSYALENLLDSEKINNTRFEQTPQIMEQLLGQLDGVFMAKNFTWYQPFMVGLSSEALIQYYNERQQDPRIIFYLQKALDGLWEQAWVPGGHAFAYRCYSNGCYTPKNESVYPPTGTLIVPNIENMPDLNLLIAPAFAWLYLQTGNPLYLERGDDIFANGVKYDGLWASPGAGKPFSQSYRWSFDYVKYRRMANNLATNAGTNVALQPGEIQVAVMPKIYSSLQNLTNQNILSSQYTNNFLNATSTDLQLIAQAFAGGNIAGVQFQIDGKNVGPAILERPFETTVQTSLFENGPHSVSAIAFTKDGQSAAGAAKIVNINRPVNNAMQKCSEQEAPANAFLGCYYNHGPVNSGELIYSGSDESNVAPAKNLGDLVLKRQDLQVNFNWSNENGNSTAPVKGLNNSYFAGVWIGNFNLEAGQYTFNLATDEGARLYIDKQKVFEGWWKPDAPNPSVSVNFLSPATHQIRVEYYHTTADHPAKISLLWDKGGALNNSNSLNLSKTYYSYNSSSSVRIGKIVYLPNQEVFYVSAKGLLSMKDVAAFLSWGFSFEQIIPANSSEAALPIIGNLSDKNSNCSDPYAQFSGNCNNTANSKTFLITSPSYKSLVITATPLSCDITQCVYKLEWNRLLNSLGSITVRLNSDSSQVFLSVPQASQSGSAEFIASPNNILRVEFYSKGDFAGKKLVSKTFKTISTQ